MRGPSASNQKTQVEGNNIGKLQQTYQEVQRVPAPLSGQGHHQTQEYLVVQVSPLILSHLKEEKKNL